MQTAMIIPMITITTMTIRIPMSTITTMTMSILMITGIITMLR